MGFRNFTAQVETLEDLGAQTLDFTSTETRTTETARAIAIWLLVTAVSGTTPSLELIVETSIDESNWFEIGRISAVTVADIYAIAFNRADHPLGKFLRVRGDLSGTTPSFTLQVDMERME